MSTTQLENPELENEARGPLLREFVAELAPGEGRTVDLRIVPYGIAAEVSDGGPRYREEWMHGAFDDQLRAANRVDVLLNFEHQAGIGGLIGRGLRLESQSDGLYGSFRIFDGQDGDKALELVQEGVLGGVSLEAYPKRSVRTSAGIVQRVKAHLDKVALCRRPAIPGAAVLAIREEIILDEEVLAFDLDPELVERCRLLGVELPARYATHPGEGTPDDGSGTPDDEPAPVPNDGE
jgi:HK97 family phage prohead protease